MMERKITPRGTRSKISFPKIPLPWIALGVGAVIAYLLFSMLYWQPKRKNVEADKEPLKEQAILHAQRAVREKIGDSLWVAFQKQSDVQAEKDSLYEVRSQIITTGRHGEQRKRSWMVTLQYQGGEAVDAKSWEVLSCDIGQ